jgi:hypothetical protein
MYRFIHSMSELTLGSRYAHGTLMARDLARVFTLKALAALDRGSFLFYLSKEETYLFYIRTQCVPRSKHYPLRL